MYSIISVLQPSSDDDDTHYNDTEISYYTARTRIDAIDLVSKLIIEGEINDYLHYKKNGKYGGPDLGFSVLYNGCCVHINSYMPDTTDYSTEYDVVDQYQNSMDFINFYDIEYKATEKAKKCITYIREISKEEIQYKEYYMKNKESIEEFRKDVKKIRELSKKYGTKLGDMINGPT